MIVVIMIVIIILRWSAALDECAGAARFITGTDDRKAR